MESEIMPAVTIGTKITEQQRDELDAYIAQFYPGLERAEYLRRVIAQDMADNGIEWTEETFISNEKRRGKPIPWKPEKNRWNKNKD